MADPPDLTISAEPWQVAAIRYLPLAPPTPTAAANAQLELQLAIRNNSAQTVHVNRIDVQFRNPPSVQVENVDFSINAGEQGGSLIRKILDYPAPTFVTLSVWCDGFFEPKKETFPLAPYYWPPALASMAERGLAWLKGSIRSGYRFPAKPSDLRDGEHWSGGSAAHDTVNLQEFAHDLFVRAFDPGPNPNHELLPGGDRKAVESYRIWGKPVYAMARGTVVEFEHDLPDRSIDDGPDPVGGNYRGNFFVLQHDRTQVTYAHLQRQSFPSRLRHQGAAVGSHEFLGLVGKSGNSDRPHLHIHATTDPSKWSRPLPFSTVAVLDESLILQAAPDPAAPWTEVDGQGLPRTWSAIMPGEPPFTVLGLLVTGVGRLVAALLALIELLRKRLQEILPRLKR